MRIDGVEAIAVDIPLRKNFGGSTYAVLKRSTVVTRLRTDDGLMSEVYNGDNREHGAEIVRLIRDELSPLVKGENIFDIERIWEKMFALTRPTAIARRCSRRSPASTARVWDVIGKATGNSVRELLGGYRDRVPIISIGGYYMEGKTLADIGREMELYRDAGMAGCKFKVGGLSPQEDAKRVEAARKAAGADFMLAVDANRGWTADDAIEFARLVEPLDIRWFEEPCHWYDDAAMMARVARRPDSHHRRPVRDHQPRRAPADRCRRRRFRQLRRVRRRRRHRLAARRRAVRRRRRADGSPRGSADRAAPARRHPARHLCIECFADPDRDPVWQ